MGKITFVLSDSLESRLRKVVERKGDLSKIAEKSIDAWLRKLDEKDRLFAVEEEAQRHE